MEVFSDERGLNYLLLMVVGLSEGECVCAVNDMAMDLAKDCATSNIFW